MELHSLKYAVQHQPATLLEPWSCTLSNMLCNISQQHSWSYGVALSLKYAVQHQPATLTEPWGCTLSNMLCNISRQHSRSHGVALSQICCATSAGNTHGAMGLHTFSKPQAAKFTHRATPQKPNKAKTPCAESQQYWSETFSLHMHII